MRPEGGFLGRGGLGVVLKGCPRGTPQLRGGPNGTHVNKGLSIKCAASVLVSEAEGEPADLLPLREAVDTVSLSSGVSLKCGLMEEH